MRSVLVLTFVLLCARAYGTITIDTVPVRDIGNADFIDPFGIHLGGVNYAYSIGKYEVTVGQYSAFLNAVAAIDIFSLYNPSMASDANVAGISQSCSPNCTYSVIGSPNHPVTYVSSGDAARFANWLNNGQPTGAEGPGTTETGAYTLNGATSSAALLPVTRSASATWFITTENEWYKAAYYQPASKGGDSDSYWDYPMKTNTKPYSDQPPGATPNNTRVGNFSQDDGVANGYDDGYAVTGLTSYSSGENYLTDVGAYSSSLSYYGTFDQGGNVWEWMETNMNSGRQNRGGGFTSNGLDAASNRRDFADPARESPLLGFRVASAIVPEPSTLLLAVGIFAPLDAYRRRRS